MGGLPLGAGMVEEGLPAYSPSSLREMHPMGQVEMPVSLIIHAVMHAQQLKQQQASPQVVETVEAGWPAKKASKA